MVSLRDSAWSRSPLIVDTGNFIQREALPARVIVALSGGLDSMTLLHVLAALRDPLGLCVQAVHVNHGLHEYADQWQAHCESFCRDLNITLRTEPVRVENRGRGIEDEARKRRYQALLRHCGKDCFLAVAHHRRDQAETVLLNLFRGAGVHGLQGMQPVREVRDTIIARPFLNQPKTILERYAQRAQLTPADDPANRDERLTRSFVRARLFPVLESRWPGVEDVLARFAERIRSQGELLDELAALDAAAAIDCTRLRIRISELSNLTPVREANLLRYWLRTSVEGEPLIPSAAQLEEIQRIGKAKSSSSPRVVLDRFEVRRFDGYLWLLRKDQIADLDLAPRAWTLDRNSQIEELDLELQAETLLAGIPALDQEQRVEVRFRDGGETIKWRGKTRKVKELLRVARIPPWGRNRVPLIYVEDRLMAVWGVTVAIDQKATLNGGFPL